MAMAATKGIRQLPAFTADNILIDGMRLDFSNVQPGGEPPAAPYASLVGPVGSELVPPTGQFVSRYTPLTLGGVPGRVIQIGRASCREKGRSASWCNHGENVKQ